MRQKNRWWLILVLPFPMVISGCDTSRRVDAQRLSLAVEGMDVAADPTPRRHEEAVPMGPIDRLSADPAAMAAACALRAGQVAQGMGRHSVAREMFQMIVTNFPQPRYRYYSAEARQGLEQLDAARSGWFQQHTAI
jgi:hypothetical protein